MPTEPPIVYRHRKNSPYFPIKISFCRGWSQLASFIPRRYIPWYPPFNFHSISIEIHKKTIKPPCFLIESPIITNYIYIYIYIPIKPSKNHDWNPIKSWFHHYSTTISKLLLHRLGRGATLCRSAGKRAALGLELDMDWAWPGDVVTMVQWMGRRDILPENHAQMLQLGHIYIHLAHFWSKCW